MNLGLKSVRCIAFATEGQVLAESSRPIQTLLSNEKVEQDPREWRASTWEVLGSVVSQLQGRANQVRFITVTTSASCLTVLNAKGQPLGNAILVSDTRAVHEAERLNNTVEFQSVFAETAMKSSPDLMLPKIDGREVCRQIRARGQTPVIMLTARGEEIDKLVGLELGADDYITKPFSPRELVARVKAVLRRSGKQDASAESDVLRFDDLQLSGSKRTVENKNGPVHLTAREFDLLHYLASHPGHVFSRPQLMDAVWDYEFAGDTSTVTVHMRRLRSKVELDP
ncbi:MAG: winged helix-turn-helix domain-containing protein, partial [Proteobacteria bacterium]|nr:winged helix-turn-helix domain-containing protein [Pseudomonadota bacterium]